MRYNINVLFFTQYFGIISAVPNHWKISLYNRIVITGQVNLLSKVAQQGKITRWAYKQLIMNTYSLPTARYYWDRVLSNPNDWNAMFTHRRTRRGAGGQIAPQIF